jgi:hypothetical protein
MAEAEDIPTPPGTVDVERKRVVTSRRAVAGERRTRRFVMLMSDQDHARVKAVADARGVSMARLMQESALSESYDRRERMAMIAALDTANRLLANVAGNINQLARHANIAQQLAATADLETALGHVRVLREELGETLRQIR